MIKKRAAFLFGGGPFSGSKRLLRVLDALEERAVLRAVLLAYRRGSLEEGFLVGFDELHALGLQLVGRLRGLLVPQLALLELRLAREFLHQRLVFLGERLPGALGEDKDLGDDQVAGEAVYLGDLVMVLRQNGRLVVLR